MSKRLAAPQPSIEPGVYLGADGYIINAALVFAVRDGDVVFVAWDGPMLHAAFDVHTMALAKFAKRYPRRFDTYTLPRCARVFAAEAKCTDKARKVLDHFGKGA